MKIKIDKDLCIGCGTCARLCEKVFEIKDGKAQVKKEINLEKNKKCIEEAQKSCPVEAIQVLKEK